MQDFKNRLDKKELVVGVVGLGYVGLPLVLEFAKTGYKVIGFDIDQSKCQAISQGQSYIRHIPSEKVSGAVKTGLLKATTDFKEIQKTDAVLICVPTPLTKQREPDMSYIEKTAHLIGPHLKKNHLVCLESTTYPGTTNEILRPILEKHSGLKSNESLFLAFSPEREDPANPNYTTRTIPKVVGGAGEQALAMARDLYSQIIEKVVTVSSAEAAESTKLLENIYRSVNIALVNELKVVFDKMGVNIWEVIRAASTKPFGFTPFYPGPGLGGHCIPIDPFYLTWKAREFGVSTKFIELAGEVNSAMPEYVVAKTQDALNGVGKAFKGSKILLLGLAYKKNVDDYRESPTLALIEKLEEKGVVVDFHDPFIGELPASSHHPKVKGRKSVAFTAESLRAFNAVLIVTDHDSVNYGLLESFDGPIVDTRNALESRKVKVKSRVFA
jgi:UDP-N-acetyl-D-glucosamine dehydrogenase